MTALSAQGQQKVTEEAKKLVEVITLEGSYYKFRGRCKECGWQSFAFDEEQAKQAVEQHGQRHWQEIMMQQLGQGAGQAEAGGQRERPEGVPKPGQQAQRQPDHSTGLR